jgi:hypothetical protein
VREILTSPRGDQMQAITMVAFVEDVGARGEMSQAQLGAKGLEVGRFQPRKERRGAQQNERVAWRGARDRHQAKQCHKGNKFHGLASRANHSGVVVAVPTFKSSPAADRVRRDRPLGKPISRTASGALRPWCRGG